MMWVKLTLPPRVRARWLLRMRRLTSMSLAGTSRKLVAVGTPSDASMLVTMRAAAPRSGSPSGGAAGAGGVGAAVATGVGVGVATEAVAADAAGGDSVVAAALEAIAGL